MGISQALAEHVECLVFPLFRGETSAGPELAAVPRAAGRVLPRALTIPVAQVFLATQRVSGFS